MITIEDLNNAMDLKQIMKKIRQMWSSIQK